MKIDRLLSIVIQLLNRDRVPAKELAKKYDVTVRTIYRDIDTINEAGIPVISYPGNNGGFGIMENFKLDRQVFGVQDMLSVLTALKGIQGALTDSGLDSAIDKMDSIMPKGNTPAAEGPEQFVIDFMPWGYQEKQRQLIQTVSAAVNKRKLLSFTYKNSSGRVLERLVEPMTLIFKGYAWYLFGYCKIRNDFRVFRLSRMRNLRTEIKGFVRKTAHWQNYMEAPAEEQETIDIELQFAEGVRYQMEDYFGEDAVTEMENGMCTASFQMPKGDWIHSFLLSFADSIKVVSPEWLRLELVEKCRKIEELNSKPDIGMSQG